MGLTPGDLKPKAIVLMLTIAWMRRRERIGMDREDIESAWQSTLLYRDVSCGMGRVSE